MKCTLTTINCRGKATHKSFDYVEDARIAVCQKLRECHNGGREIIYKNNTYVVRTKKGVPHRIYAYFIWRVENGKVIFYKLTKRQEITAWVK